MASTREERLQMRQRGAGTRKIQQVDFGFAFGGLEAGPSDPAPSLFPEPAKQPQTQPAPSTATPLPPKTSQPESQTGSQPERTPGSARNVVPPRPSTYDIPLDDEPEVPRSSKRRRMNPSDENAETPSRRISRKSGSDGSNTAGNGVAAPNEASANQDPDISQNVHNETNRPDTVTQAENEQPSQTGIIISRPDDTLPTNTTAPPRKSRSPQAPSHETQPIAKPTDPASKKQRQKKSSSSPQAGRSSPKQTKEKKAREQMQHTTHQPEESAAIENSQKGPESEVDSGDVAETQKSSNASKKAREPKARQNNGDSGPSQAAKKTVQDAVTQPKPTNGQSKDSHGKRPASRESIPGKATNKKTKTRVEPEPEPEPVQPGSEAEPGPSNSRRGKSGKKGKKAVQPNSPVREEQPETEGRTDSVPVAGPSRSRRSKAGKKDTEPDAPATAAEERPTAEETPESGPSKSRAARRGKKTKTATEIESTSREAQPETETAQEGRRKTREPRGETVPVTVHRLVNPAALDAMHASVGSGDEDEESADQPFSQDMDNLPNRGGVNPADVLGQICRETLEKTLTALQNGISNETNTQRRAEWTRKRKAVEAFGSELDSRLLDLSEMLDSNFVLGVQLKKAKREMMDLRGRLYKVRQERESITLQMDAVRGKHMEEEAVKISRTTINNSLHSLDLALDRSQNRASPTTDPSSADLEFILRTVGEDVSCRAPGAHGGLLNQIRAFNAQLETTARRLEGK